MSIGVVPLSPASRPAARRLNRHFVAAKIGGGAWMSILGGYFGLLAIAVVFKFLGSGWGDIQWIPVDYGPLHRSMIRIGRLLLIYRADIIDTWLFVAVLGAAALVFPRLRLNVAVWIAMTVGLLTAAACWLALMDTGVPLTRQTLMICINWGIRHPDVIPQVVPLRRAIALTVVAIAYGAIPTMLARWVRDGVALPRTRRAVPIVLTVVAAFLVVAAMVSPGPLVPTVSKTMSPAEGYWISTFASLADVDVESPTNLNPKNAASVLAEYRRIAYPYGRPSTPMPIVAPMPVSTRPLHVVIISLETAPYRYYPLGTDTTLRNFQAMAGHAIVGSEHLATRPYTLFSVYSMLTGTYHRPGAPIGEYGPYHPDDLALTLGKRGYEATYIDSYRIDWGYHNRRDLAIRGYAHLLDTAEAPHADGVDPFDQAVDHERWSFGKALQAVTGAQARGTRALVFIQTHLGHSPWPARAGHEHESAGAKLHAIASELDTVTGEFLRQLDRAGLKDSVIVVVTGDHGLRYLLEFRSFGHRRAFGDVDYHVPLLIYAPSLFKHRIDIPYTTSHVDIAPTLYTLLGVPTDSLLVLGENMLDQRIADRATFVMGTGISPLDGFELEGHRYTLNAITHELTVRPAPDGAAPRDARWTPASVGELLRAANHAFNLTAAYFLKRAQPLERAQPLKRAQPREAATHAGASGLAARS